MLLLKLKTIKHSKESSELKSLGIKTKSEVILINTLVNLDKMTHFEENVDDEKLTNIYLMSGHMIITPMSVDEFTEHLYNFVVSAEAELNDEADSATD